MSTMSDSALRRLRDAADAPDLTGTKYEIVDRIGQGGMGTVYRARDRELGREIALKVVRLPEGAPDIAARMMREARTLARLEHPGIVPVHDVGTLVDGRVFYAMKLVRGAPLHELSVTGLADRLRIVERVCEAVAFAHAHGVIHRDLKPQNVMVGPWHYPGDQMSDLPMRQLAAEITREKLYHRLHQELPYQSTVETESWKELKDGSVRIEQTIYVERDSQKKIVLGHKGETIRSIGQASRKDIGEILEQKVHLFLFVKVRENWGDDPERYREMGLEFPR